MKNKNLLVVTSRSNEQNTLQEWMGIAHPFHVTLMPTDEGAIECCHLQQFDIVVIDNMDTTIDAKKLGAVLPILQEDVVMFRYEGESADDITETINAIINARKYKRILNMILLEPGENNWEVPSVRLN